MALLIYVFEGYTTEELKFFVSFLVPGIITNFKSITNFFFPLSSFFSYFVDKKKDNTSINKS